MNTNFDIKQFIFNFNTSCHKSNLKTFSKGETITTYIQKRNQFCILVDGTADLVRYDFNGDRIIIEHFSKYDTFGEVFYNITVNNELLVEAKKKCTVIFYNYDDLEYKCTSNCKFHSTLTKDLPELILNKVKVLNMRIELLSKRSTRDKLLSFFSLLSSQTHSKKITLPFSLTDLADYLSVDRSAMMRELKLLKDDELIEKIGNTIVLLYK